MLGLRTTIYYVSNILEAKQWYAKAFQVAPYFDESFYVGFNINGFELGLHPQDVQSPEKGTSVVSYWGVRDILNEYSRLLELGASAHESPKSVGGEIMVASVKDPWGNILGIIYNPSFSVQDDAS